MRNRFGKALRIGLSKTGVTVVRTSGLLQTRSEILAELVIADKDDNTSAAVVTRLGALLGDMDCARMPADIVLSDTWVRSWMVAPPQNAASLADCRAAANARFQVLFGESMADWELQADWDARRPFLACAVPRKLLAALLQAASDNRLVLRTVAPQFVVAWNRWRASLQEGNWFGVLGREMLTCAVLGRHGPVTLREVALPDEAARDQRLFPEILAREALRLNVPMPTEIRLCGQVPADWVMPKIGNLGFVRLDMDRHMSFSASAESPMSSGLSLALTGMNS
jgi:hypothetical protein